MANSGVGLNEDELEAALKGFDAPKPAKASTSNRLPDIGVGARGANTDKLRDYAAKLGITADGELLSEFKGQPFSKAEFDAIVNHFGEDIIVRDGEKVFIHSQDVKVAAQSGSSPKEEIRRAIAPEKATEAKTLLDFITGKNTHSVTLPADVAEEAAPYLLPANKGILGRGTVSGEEIEALVAKRSDIAKHLNGLGIDTSGATSYDARSLEAAKKASESRSQ